jgi:hypothetical protein
MGVLTGDLMGDLMGVLTGEVIVDALINLAGDVLGAGLVIGESETHFFTFVAFTTCFIMVSPFLIRYTPLPRISLIVYGPVNLGANLSPIRVSRRLLHLTTWSPIL